jgi:hypothetical protein
MGILALIRMLNPGDRFVWNNNSFDGEVVKFDHGLLGWKPSLPSLVIRPSKYMPGHKRYGRHLWYIDRSGDNPTVYAHCELAVPVTSITRIVRKGEIDDLIAKFWRDKDGSR